MWRMGTSPAQLFFWSSEQPRSPCIEKRSWRSALNNQSERQVLCSLGICSTFPKDVMVTHELYWACPSCLIRDPPSFVRRDVFGKIKELGVPHTVETIEERCQTTHGRLCELFNLILKVSVSKVCSFTACPDWICYDFRKFLRRRQSFRQATTACPQILS
jgi:hypothetical protein